MLVTTELQDFARALAPKQRLLGLDLGRKRIGVALSDATRRIASPHTILPHRRNSETQAQLQRLMARSGARGAVIGLALHMQGGLAPRAQSAQAFARQLARRCACPVYLQDERLSSAGAARILHAAGLSRAKQEARLDAMAAAWILQTALNGLQALHADAPAATKR